MNPLATLALKFPHLFGLEWVDDDDFVRAGDGVYDVRPIRQIRGPWYYVEVEADDLAREVGA